MNRPSKHQADLRPYQFLVTMGAPMADSGGPRSPFRQAPSAHLPRMASTVVGALIAECRAGSRAGSRAASAG